MADTGAKRGVTSPPAGTGQVAGLGEAFRINLNTGQGVYSYKLPLPDGIAGFTPQLSLEYAHGNSHGLFGFGWRLPVRRISRRLDYGTGGDHLHESFSDSGVEIMPVEDGVFGSVNETGFARYHRLDEGWRIEERNGTVHHLGRDSDARLSDPDNPQRVTDWLLEESVDPCGNAIEYRYVLDEGTACLSEVRYAAYAVRFEYEARPDQRWNGRAGYLRRLSKRCARIELYLDPGPGERLIRSWSFRYQIEELSQLSLLSQIELISHGAADDGSDDIIRPPVRFTYSDYDPQDWRAGWMQAEGTQPPPLDDPEAALVVLDNAPLPGILQVVGGKQYYWANHGNGTWAHPAPLQRQPLIGSFQRAGVAFIDVDASGTADLLQAGNDEPIPGYYENGGRGGWQRFVAYPRASRTKPAWTSGSTRLTDADGNGQVDAIMSTRRAFAVWLNRGEHGWSEPLLAPRGSGEDRPDVDLGEPTVRLADMTGDGLQDLVRVRSGRVEFWPALGHGRYGTRIVMQQSPRLRDLHRLPENLFLMDVNGDGCDDLVFVSAAGIEVYLNRNGESFGEGSLLADVPPPVPGTIRPADMSGSGRAGLLYNSWTSRGSGYVQVKPADEQVPYLLTAVDSGTGLRSEIRYRPATEDYQRDRLAGEQWDTNFPFPLMVVASTREEDAVSGQVVETEYRYHEAHYEMRTRQFQGFRRAERVEKGDESRPDTLTAFHFLMAQERLPGNGPEHAALNGLLRRTEVYGLDGSEMEDRPYFKEEADYGLSILNESPDGRKRTFIFVTARRSEDIERTDDIRGEERTYEYDPFGNVVRERLRGYGVRSQQPQPERVRVTETEYAQSENSWIIDKPSRITVRDQGGTILTEIRRYYDGPDFGGLPLGEVDRGLSSREEHLILSQAEFDAHYADMETAALGYHTGVDADGNPAVFVNAESHAYQPNGLKKVDRDPLGNERSYEYDPDGLFRTRLIDSLGETVFEYDRAVGEPVRIRYADGTETQIAYDAQGRIRTISMPGELEEQPVRILTYDDHSIPNSRMTTFRSGSNGETSRTVMYFDGRGKDFQERIETGEGRFLVSGLVRRNPWGDVREEFEPTLEASGDFGIPSGAGRPSRKFFFDARGRVIKTVNYNRGISTAHYLPFEIVTSDANDNDDSQENQDRGQFETPRREEFDVLRDRVRTIEALGSASELVTEFQPGPLGELLSVSDMHGELCRYEYDRVGNRLQIDHREVGERRTWFDARRKAVRSQDARGNDIRAEIDERGRLRRLSANGDSLEEYRYDDPVNNALGRLAEVRYPGGKQVFRYDEAGRLKHHEHHFEGNDDPHTIRYEYDDLGRETTRIHPDGTRVRKELTPNGWVRSIDGILDRVDYDSRGLPIRIQFANGVVTENSFTPGAGRITRRRTTGPGGQVMEDVQCDYDQLGMMLSTDDSSPGGAGLRTYRYDPLYQLTGFESIEGGNPVSRFNSYSGGYNLTRFDEAGLEMHYDDPLHPDRVMGLTRPGEARFDVGYDANGNITELPGKKFHWDAKDMLQRFEDGDGLVADYRYDHKGIRVSKRIDDGNGGVTETLFIGDLVEIRNGTPSYFVHLGHMRVAIIQEGNTRFVHNDHLGGTAFYSDQTGTKISSIAYRPFGNLASSSGVTDFRTYGIHPFDTESGLYYMKRRYYASELGRFLTPDPLAIYQPAQYLSNPKALHPYIFSGNDPVNKVDLDGYSFWSVVGAIVGVIAAIAVAALVVMTGGALGIILGIALAIGLVTVGYVVADATAGSDFGEFMRGFLIGLNAGFNAIIATALFGPVVGVALGVINFLAAVDTIANSEIYQGILGWSSWLMPMSWLATAIGLIFFVLNVIPAIFTLNKVDAVKIENISIDWGTGTIVMEGGWLFLPGFRGGYNLGNFAYITPGSTVLDHETGHTLSVAAFGSIFHFVGAIDENAIRSDPHDAYAERIAESHDPNTTDPDIIPMWV